MRIPLLLLAPLLGLVSIVLTGLAVFGLYDRASQSQNKWEEYSIAERSLVYTFNDLRSRLGYTGLIHHFKNAVLRGDPYYYLTWQSFSEARFRVRQLQDMLTEPEALAALDTIQITLDAYLDQVARIRHMKADGVSAEDIDDMVRVMDDPAQEAFEVIANIIDQRADARLAEARREEEDLSNQLVRAAFALPVMLLVSGGLAWLGMRLDNAREDVRQARQRFEELPDPALMIDSGGHVLLASRLGKLHFGHLTGTSLQDSWPGLWEAMGASLGITIGADGRDRILHPDKEKDAGFQAILPWRAGDGSEFLFDITAMPVRSNQASLSFMLSLRDITEREKTRKALARTEKALAESERLASLGRLVAGVAHEVNTPLGVILTGVSTLREVQDDIRDSGTRLVGKMPDEAAELLGLAEEGQEIASLIQRNASRASELIRSFKQVAADQSSGKMRQIDLEEFLKELVASLRPALKKSTYEVVLACPEGLTLKTEPGGLSQVLTNLVMNAVEHGFGEEQEGRISIMARQEAEGRISIICADNGRGIPKDLARRVFEPFFTTRDGVGGTGLGLSISANVVSRQLGGHLLLLHSLPDWCDWPEERSKIGAVFEIELPPVAPGKGETPAAEESGTG